MHRIPFRILSIIVVLTALVIAITAGRLSQRSEVDPPSGATSRMSGQLSALLAADPPATPLQEGERLLQTGDYSAALAKLQPLIGHSEAAVDADARLAAARALVGNGEVDAAREMLAGLESAHPQRSEAAQGQMVLAEILKTQGNDQGALDAYRQAGEGDADLRPYAGLQIVDILLGQGQLDAALHEASAAADAAKNRRTSVEALEQVRAIQIKQDDQRGFLETTERLLDLATIPSYRAELTYQAAQARQALGDDRAAADKFQDVVASWPESPYAAGALASLADLKSDQHVLGEQRGLVLYDSGQYLQAIDAFTAALQINPKSDLAWFYRALARSHAGNAPLAIDELRQMAQRFPAGTYTARALVSAGQLLHEAGQDAAAAQAYQLVIDQFPRSAEVTEARFQLGMLRYRAGDPKAAVVDWQPSLSTADDGGKTAFWLGKAKAALGDQGGAAEAFRTATSRGGDDYFGLRAGDLLRGNVAAKTTGMRDGLSLGATKSDVEELARWYRSQRTDAISARDRVAHAAGFERARKLLDLGMLTEAGWEIDDLASEYKDDPAMLATLAWLVSEQGDYTDSFQVAEQAVTLAQQRKLGVPRFIDRLRFPIPYPDIVMAQARAEGVDPLLFAALMRRESKFDPHATSSAGARGLTQVVPDTGAQLASTLGFSDWTPDYLYRPVVSIRFGAIYLADRLAHYDGRIIPSLAAYNAGDGAVDTWLQQTSTSDPDLFAETIPYPETHGYVMNVYRDYLNYVRLYAGGQ